MVHKADDLRENVVRKLFPAGYCQVTCGRCDCCHSLADILASNNATILLEAAQIAGLDKQLASPASMFTLLAPTDASFAAALSALHVESLAAVPSKTLEAILDYHIIPPHAAIDAVWTTPFLAASRGAPITTGLPNAPLTFAATGNGLTVTGASNSAKIVTPDIEACKSYINMIDAVLLPPAGSVAAPLPNSAGNIAAAFVYTAPTPLAAADPDILNSELVAPSPIHFATVSAGVVDGPAAAPILSRVQPNPEMNLSPASD